MVARQTLAFDLDMTLVDSRPGIRAALVAFANESGYPIDADAIVAALGPPVAEALAPYVPADNLAEAIDRFREHMAAVGVMDVAPLPGAAEAIAAARHHGLDVAVVTSKIRHLAVATLQHAGLNADEVYGDFFGAAKAEPLRQTNAVAYVGDHPADILAAVKANVAGIGVTTGHSTKDELVDAGATTVLTSLEEVPDYLVATTSR